MVYVRSGAPAGLRWSLFALATITSAFALSGENAVARQRNASSKSSGPAQAAIVVDANSATVLHAANADAPRHPASLTKIMTLYLLFERLESGKLKLDTPLKVSDHAEEQPPTKLGLREDQTIKVEDAIKGMITRSANDVAVVVAEALADSEENFAKMMTRKAQALGMTKTVYKNASGLPNNDQITTARDQAILGRAIQERFPTYYKYFQTRSFVFRGQSIANHNRLLGSVDGVDGIKTGYTHASGFNLVTSVRRNNRHLVAVVLGGSSAASRDAQMRRLLAEHIPAASAKRTAPMVAEAPAPKAQPKTAQKTVPPAADARPKSEKDDQRFNLASASSTAVQLDPPSTAAIPATALPGSTEPIRPVIVRTLNVKPGGAIHTASIMPLPFAALTPSETAAIAPEAEVSPAPPGAGPGVLGQLPAPATTPAPEPAPVTASAKPPVRSGWIIQVGAYPDETAAKQRLSTVKSTAARLLAAADPFTEPTVKGGTTYYRARFAGLDKDRAEAACKFLRRNDVDCLAIKN
jgi:D-alanyl-D-alanine carboxypeptidase